MEECVVLIVVVDLVEGLVDDVGSVGGANATLCRVEVGLDLGGGLEEDGFGGESAQGCRDAKWADLAGRFQFCGQGGGEDGLVDVVGHFSHGYSVEYGGDGAVVLGEVVEGLPVLVASGVWPGLPTGCEGFKAFVDVWFEGLRGEFGVVVVGRMVRCRESVFVVEVL